MLESQKLSLRLSKLRQELSEVPEDAEDSVVDKLTDEYSSVETQYRRAIVMEAEDQRQAEERGEMPDPAESQDREFSELVRSASLRDYLHEAISGSPITDGASLELRQATLGAAAAEGYAPFAVLSNPYSAEGQPLEYRLGSDLATTVAAAPGTMQRPIAQEVFARSDAMYLGVDMPMVPTGATAFPFIASGATAGPSSPGTARAAAAGMITVRNIEPIRVDAAYLFNDRERHTVAGLEDALRVNLVDSLTDAVDDQIINGDGVDPNFRGFLAALTDGTAPTADATGLTYIRTLAGAVDGKMAYVLEDVKALVGVATYQDAAGQLITAGGQLVIDRLGPMQFRASSRIPAPATSGANARDQAAILYRSMGMGRAVAPMWEGVMLVRDNVTSADQGRIRITASLYTGFLLVRADAHQQVGFQLAA